MDYAQRYNFGPRSPLGEHEGVRRDETEHYIYLRGSEHLTKQLANWGRQSFSGMYADAWSEAERLADVETRPRIFRGPNLEEKGQLSIEEQIRAKRNELDELEARL